jgi:hypothetical protein
MGSSDSKVRQEKLEEEKKQEEIKEQKTNATLATNYWRDLSDNCYTVSYEFRNNNDTQSNTFVRLIPKCKISYPHELYFRITNIESKFDGIYTNTTGNLFHKLNSCGQKMSYHKRYGSIDLMPYISHESFTINCIVDIKDNYVAFEELPVNIRNQALTLQNWHTEARAVLVRKETKNKNINVMFTINCQHGALFDDVYEANLNLHDFKCRQYKLVSFRKNGTQLPLHEDLTILRIDDNSTEDQEIKGIIDHLKNTYVYMHLNENIDRHVLVQRSVPVAVPTVTDLTRVGYIIADDGELLPVPVVMEDVRALPLRNDEPNQPQP